MSTVAQTDALRACPKCRSKEPWGVNSWCPSCGFYPKFADRNFQVPEPVEPATPQVQPETEGPAEIEGPPEPDSELEPTTAPEAISKPVAIEPPTRPQRQTRPAEVVNAFEVRQQAAKFKQWLRVLTCGVGFIIVCSLGLRFTSLLSDIRPAFFACVEIMVGCGFMFVGSVLISNQLKLNPGHGSAFAVFTQPRKLWKPTLEQVPKTQKPAWFFAWGITMIVAANVLVGGIKYSGITTGDWGFETSDFATATGGDAVADEKLLKELKQYASSEGAEAKPSQPTIDSVIYGVLKDKQGNVERILMARKIDGQLKHCAIIRSGTLAEADYQKLQSLVSEHIVEEAPLKSSLDATWVTPVVGFKLTFGGFVGPELVNAKFHSFTAE